MIEAVINKPTVNSSLIGFAALMRMVFNEIDLKPLATHLFVRTKKSSNDANAMMDLSTILQLGFQREIALQLQMEALKIQRVFNIAAAIQPAKIKLLVIMGACDLLSNTPVECLLENSDIELNMLYVAPGLPFPDTTPEHDVLFVAISDSAQNRPLLIQLSQALRRWSRPILNSPARIAFLPRDCTYALLSEIDHVDMPCTVRVGRDQLFELSEQENPLSDVAEFGGLPIIIRPTGSQAGRGLVKIEAAADISNYLQTMSESEFYISPFVDFRSTDGLYRKYRIVLIDGRPFICHLAISSNWLIHYLNAGMAESAEKRAEEERCFTTFDSEFALRHASAFHSIYKRMGLDYLGIDCGETPDGKLLIFEVDSNMIVHAFDPTDVFPYKQKQMQKVFTAFRKMLIKTGGLNELN